MVNRLSRRPGKPAAGQKMEVDMENGLTCIMTVINDHAVAALLKTLLRSKAFCNKEQMSDKFPLRKGDAVNAGDMLFRDKERMDRRLGIDVFKSEGKLVFINDLRRNFSFDDFAENTVWVQRHRFPQVSAEKLRKKQLRCPVWQAGPV
jgi:hypothetical protein